MKELLIAAFAVSALTWQVSASARTDQVKIHDSGEVSCEQCGKGAAVSWISVGDAYFGIGSQVHETNRWALLREDAGISCPAGKWYFIDKKNKRLELEEATAVGADCNEIEAIKLTEVDDGLKVSVKTYNGLNQEFILN